MKKNNQRKGFTLIELMIVVAIIGILAAIAIPNFIRYQLRSKTTEVKVVMGGIKTSQESFRAEYDNYVAAVRNPAAAVTTVKVPWDTNPCAATCTRQANAQCTRFACIGYEPAGQVYYRYATARRLAATDEVADFTADGIADLDGDSANGEFTYRTTNSTGQNNSTLQGGLTTGCTGSIPGGEVYDCNPNVY